MAMKVVCESCQAKYQVPDERVAGKKLKIRCKRCGATVLIRGDLEQAAAPSTELESYAPPAGATAGSEAVPALEWHVSLDGTAHGPFNTDELIHWLNTQPDGWESHVWRDGFPDWLDARACAELNPPSEQTSVAPPNSEEAPTDTFQNAALNVAPILAEAAARRGAARASTIRARTTSSGYAASSPRIGATEAMTGERHEDSVLFSAQKLQTMTSAPAFSSNPGFTNADEGSGLIDIRALASLARQTRYNIAMGASAAAAMPAAVGGYGDTSLSYGSDDDDSRAGLINQPSAFGRVDSLAPISNTSQTSNVAVPLAILGGCALVAAAVFGAILIARPSRPSEPVVTAPVTQQVPDPVAAAAQPPNEPGAMPQEPGQQPGQAAPSQEPPSAPASVVASNEQEEQLASGKPKRQHMPRTASDEKKTGMPEEKAKPKKEEKSEPPSVDEVMLAERAKPQPKAEPAPKPEKPEPPAKSTAAEIDDLLGAKPAAKPKNSNRSIDDLLEGADKGDKKGASAPKPAAAAPAASVPADTASDLPPAPSRDEVLAAMKSVESAVRACATGQAVQGTATVAITVSGSTGRITTANVAGITGNVGSCIARTVRNAKFPRFGKPTFSFNYPYRF
jgi:predicted Zn finger-like uncharacterized protein